MATKVGRTLTKMLKQIKLFILLQQVTFINQKQCDSQLNFIEL